MVRFGGWVEVRTCWSVGSGQIESRRAALKAATSAGEQVWHES